GSLVEVGAHHSSLSAKPVTDIWTSSETPLIFPVAAHSTFKLSCIEAGHLQVPVRYLVAKELILISPGNLTFRRINQRRVQKKTLLNAKLYHNSAMKTSHWTNAVIISQILIVEVSP